MLDLKKVREQLDLYKADLKKRNSTVDVDSILILDDQRKALQQQIDTLKFQQKELASQQDYEGAKTLKIEVQSLETKYEEVVKKLNAQLLTMPQFLSARVPEGRDETKNVEIRRIGEIPTFDFPIQDHMTLMKKYDMVDVERGVKLAGARSYFLKNDGMLLEQAVLQYALAKMVKKGFTPLTVPNIVNTECLTGTGYLP
ncbi:MAG: hypothetical protein LBI53_05960 [Candidatus Peribacteria bacterium]|jgi:seryl-tRNA synthetase|nr:hypothetical protein [Candidatus Peribacteria bacterium]